MGGRCGRKNWICAGFDEGGRRAAAIYSLIATAKLNDIDPPACLADVLARLPDHPAKRIQRARRIGPSVEIRRSRKQSARSIMLKEKHASGRHRNGMIRLYARTKEVPVIVTKFG